MTTVDEFLEHFGVKGMKWGVRRFGGGAGDVTITQRPGGRLRARGGRGIPPSDDAVLAKTAAQRVKKSGVQSLTNEELQLLNTRLNLERQFKNLQPPKSKAATKFVTDVLVQVGKQEASKVVGGLVAKQVANVLKK